jgi:hypothetical protein
MSELGERLVQVHLLRPPGLQEDFVRYKGSSGSIVKFVRFFPHSSDDNRIYLNEKDYVFGVPADAWEYMLCGYRVLDKILKKIEGKKIKPSELKHFSRVIHAVQLTIQYQRMVDELYSLIDDCRG